MIYTEKQIKELFDVYTTPGMFIPFPESTMARQKVAHWQFMALMGLPPVQMFEAEGLWTFVYEPPEDSSALKVVASSTETKWASVNVVLEDGRDLHWSSNQGGDLLSIARHWLGFRDAPNWSLVYPEQATPRFLASVGMLEDEEDLEVYKAL